MKSRQTNQKELLQKNLLTFTSFFTAEDLYHKTLKFAPDLGIATVYRFLKTSVAQGKIHSYVCDRHSVYSNHANNHSHFHCEHCKKTIHIDIKNIDFLKQSLPGKACHFQLDITGICHDCSIKINKKNQ